MERNSILYKIRRKCQVVAANLLPPDTLSGLYSKIVIKKNVDLKNPKTFNEKIQWLKIHAFPKMPLVIKGADKYAVREYIHEKNLDNITVPLLGSWDDARKIEWNKLPKQFVLKCAHGCAYNIVVSDKDKLDKEGTVKQLNKWLKEDFALFNVEFHYSKIKPRMIVCEEFLGDCIIDYKFFCFNGKPKYIYVSSDLIHDRQAQIGFFYLDGSKMPIMRDDYTDIPSVNLPVFYNQMLEDARILCKDFSFVRVDFFLANEKYYFAELTFTPGGGMMPFNPPEYDLQWGKELDISKELETYK